MYMQKYVKLKSTNLPTALRKFLNIYSQAQSEYETL